MLIINDIPLLALIIESIVSILSLTIGIMTFVKWQKRKRKATLFLSLAILGYSLAIILVNIGHYLDFFSSEYPAITYADVGLTLSFVFFLLANVLTRLFIQMVFIDETKPAFLMFFGLIHGLTIGLLLSNVSTEHGSFESNLNYLIIGVLLLLIVNGQLIFFAFKEMQKNEKKLPKIGFLLIGLFGVFIILVFIFIIADVIAITPFSVFYYLSMVTAIFAIIFAYLGYIMPDWFKHLIVK